jgi:hypothetical protein
MSGWSVQRFLEEDQPLDPLLKYISFVRPIGDPTTVNLIIIHQSYNRIVRVTGCIGTDQVVWTICSAGVQNSLRIATT